MIIKAFSNDFFTELKYIRKQSIVFFNGVFDIIHPGHIKLINKVKEKAKEYGDNTLIICAINSDESVKKQNKEHPLINNETARALMLELLGINHVLIFNEENPLKLIMHIMPDCIVTSKDYCDNYYNYKDLIFANKHGILIDYIYKSYGYSTTNIYNTIEKQVKAKIKENL